MPKTQKTYSISELAKEFDVSTRTIRYYEEKGYLRPRRDGQKRIYSAADRTRIRLILRGKRIGMSLEECIEIIDMYNPGQDSSEQLKALIERVAERRAALEQQREDLEATLSALDEVELHCRDALAQKTRGKRSTATRARPEGGYPKQGEVR
jgi:DNA-binding transcriptional MerR regulator